MDYGWIVRARNDRLKELIIWRKKARYIVPTNSIWMPRNYSVKIFWIQIQLLPNPNIINFMVARNFSTYIIWNNLGWHKAVLVFVGISILAGSLALIFGICTPCSPPCALLHSVMCFVSCKHKNLISLLIKKNLIIKD